MARVRSFRSFAPLIGALLIASCASPDSANPTGPVATAVPSATDLLDLNLRAVTWKEQRDSAIAVSRTIDESGGTISIPQTGLTIEFPAGALSTATTITVTADDKYVAYRMEPAGTQFGQDVRVVQQLDKTSLSGLPLGSLLYVAYIADEGVNLGGMLPILELRPSTTIFSPLSPLLPQVEVWTVRHFSRYILASG